MISTRSLSIGLAILMIVVGVGGLFVFWGGSAARWAPMAARYETMMGPGGMMQGGMMEYGAQGGGMMGQGMMGGRGMMGGNYAVAPLTVTSTPAPAEATPVTVDREINLTIEDLRFIPATLTVKAGSTVRLVITNKDQVSHNLVSQTANVPYVLVPPNTTQTVVWKVPAQAGTYLALCTFHAGMTMQLVVQ